MTQLPSLFPCDEHSAAILYNNSVLQEIQLGHGTLFSEKSFTRNIKYTKEINWHMFTTFSSIVNNLPNQQYF